MRLVTYDCEVFAHDWIVVFKDYETKHFTVIHNDNAALRSCIDDDTVYIGYNTKNYDQFIIKGICIGMNNDEIKVLNDYIIAGNRGWDYPLLRHTFFWFNNADITDDAQKNKSKDGTMVPSQSLKCLEGHLGMNICESDVSFDINRPLTPTELEQAIQYCKTDVDATEYVVDLRKDYLRNKLRIGKMAGLTDAKALSMTNAKLTAALLNATKQPHDDERCYVYPDNLKKEYIPQEVFDFFNRMYDKSISDQEFFESKLETTLGDCEITIGFGGIHGAIKNYFFGGDAK